MTIVAAVDDDPGTHRILQQGRELADAFDDELHVIHVHGQYESTEEIRRESQSNPGESIDADTPKQYAREQARKLSADVIEDFTAVGRVGYPAQEILKYADEQDARYLVIGGRRRSPVGKVLFGSVTQAVLLEAGCSVVSVRVGTSE
jgi:nucleotide-binding universal stress UspA family protein